MNSASSKITRGCLASVDWSHGTTFFIQISVAESIALRQSRFRFRPQPDRNVSDSDSGSNSDSSSDFFGSDRNSTLSLVISPAAKSPESDL